MLPEKSLTMRNRGFGMCSHWANLRRFNRQKSFLRLLSIFSVHGGTLHEMIRPAG
jgi:hypothetical protein